MLREVWPEGDVFGSADVEPEEELELLKQILYANLPSQFVFFVFFHISLCVTVSVENFNFAHFIPGSSPPEPVPEDEEDAAELEEEEFESIQVSEREFNFLDFIKR